jgi:hypothetical protein
MLNTLKEDQPYSIGGLRLSDAVAVAFALGRLDARLAAGLDDPDGQPGAGVADSLCALIALVMQ